MEAKDIMNLSRDRGTLPDKFWYQLNGTPAQENYAKQKSENIEALTEEDDGEVYITSEVRVK